MVHFGKWNQWETHFLPPLISEQGCCSGTQDAPESFPITSKMDNVITRYLRLFSIKKLSNYCSLSWGLTGGPARSLGALRTVNELPETLQNLAAKLLLLPLAQRH